MRELSVANYHRSLKPLNARELSFHISSGRIIHRFLPRKESDDVQIDYLSAACELAASKASPVLLNP